MRGKSVAGKSHSFLVKGDVEDARTMQGWMMDRKYFLMYFERKHIIQSYGPPLIRPRGAKPCKNSRRTWSHL